jgi:hypothetical protein
MNDELENDSEEMAVTYLRLVGWFIPVAPTWSVGHP